MFLLHWAGLVEHTGLFMEQRIVLGAINSPAFTQPKQSRGDVAVHDCIEEKDVFPHCRTKKVIRLFDVSYSVLVGGLLGFKAIHFSITQQGDQ